MTELVENNNIGSIAGEVKEKLQRALDAV